MALAVLPEFAKLTERVSVIRGLNPGPFTLQGTNVYLVGTGPSRILIDGGQGIPQFKEHFIHCLKKLYVTSISHILFTHRHQDHIGGYNQVLEALRDDIISPGTTVTTRAWKRMTDDVEDKEFTFEPLQDRQVFSSEGATLTVHFTPGHTTDHCSFWLEEEKAVFTGDCVLGQGSAVFSDLGALLNSLRFMVGLQPERLYTGHGPHLESREASVNKIQEYIGHRLDREREILGVLKTLLGDSEMNGFGLEDINTEIVEEIVAALYMGYPDSVLGAAKRVVRLHLEKIVRDGIGLVN